ncbi:MAG: CARDB domain-containing protein [Nanoarchaeota archaeon]
MAKKMFVFVIVILLFPLAYSISFTEFLKRHKFSTETSQMNLTSHLDYMVDKDDNGINDTLIIELATRNTADNFIFVVNLFDNSGILTNETMKELGSGENKLNLSFSTSLLSQKQFNYSIKIYNSTYSLKYRKDKILSQEYRNYEEGFKILDAKAFKDGKALKINVTLNSSVSGVFDTQIFLTYNNSVIFAKEPKLISNSLQHLLFSFDNETIKKSHVAGNFNISTLKIGNKIFKINSATAYYDFKDFAATSYIREFSDGGIDINSDKKFDFLEINMAVHANSDSQYTFQLALYDLFGNLIEIKKFTSFLAAGTNTIPMDVNGSRIYRKRLSGPFVIGNAKLFENGLLIDEINNAYTTRNYNYNDFDIPDLPDLNANISVSGDYHYGISNLTVNFTFGNRGGKHAFNVFREIFDNKTLFRHSKSNILNANSQFTEEINFTDVSDIELSSVIDLQNFVEELDEDNNAKRIIIKLNKKPVLAPVGNITVNESSIIFINLSAFDTNDDKLSYFINSSRFTNNSNVFLWSTTTADSGHYALEATASDGYLNDSTEFKIVILDTPEKDIDNDGINDSVDRLIGDESSIITSTLNLRVFLGSSNNLSVLLNESVNIKILDDNLTIAEFDFNFSIYRLNLSNLIIDKQAANSTGFLLFNGLKMPEGTTKTLYVDRINETLNGVCVKDNEVLLISQISNDCISSDEFRIECDGTLQNSYICTYNSTSNKYKIQGLKHSAMVQFSYSKPKSEESPSGSSTGSSGSPGGGGGGSRVVCTPDWRCGEWSMCTDGLRKRKCIDSNQCTFTSKKPAEAESCVISSGETPKAEVSNISGNDVRKAEQKKASGDLSKITGQLIKFNPTAEISFDTALGFLLIAVMSYLTVKSFRAENF